jgi:hypothetical protein
MIVNRLDKAAYAAFYEMLVGSLEERHEVKPVHTLAEITELAHRLPGELEIWGCHAEDGRLLSGVMLLKLHEQCWHTQYIAASRLGRELHATDFLIEELIRRAQAERIKQFSFGSSTDQSGKNLNSGLFGFKSGFGVGSIVQDFYEVSL